MNCWKSTMAAGERRVVKATVYLVLGILLTGGLGLAAQQTENSTIPPDATPQGLQPYQIKSDLLGEDIRQYEQNNRGENCAKQLRRGNEDSKLYGDCMTLSGITYANIPARAKSSTFSADRLVTVMYLMQHDAFEQMKDSLIERFGPPKNRAATEYQTKWEPSSQARF